MNDITDASLSINDTTLHAMTIVRGSSKIMLFVHLRYLNQRTNFINFHFMQQT